MKITRENAISAYKMFDSDFKCRGFQYEIGEEYFHEGDVKACYTGFHACEQLKDCFEFYECVQWNKIAKVLAWGNVKHSGNKICASNILIVEEIPFSRIEEIIGEQTDSDGVNRSNGVNRSSGVNCSFGVHGSSGVNGSFGLNRSNGVNRSSGVNGSFGLNRSNGVNRSSGVNGSHGVHGSSGVNRSDGVNCSFGVNDSDGVNGSHGVNASSGVSDSFGILRCSGISNGLFCFELKPRPTLFNKKITMKRFETIQSKLAKLLNGWKPTFNNLNSLYLKCGSDWKATPIPSAKEISKKEAWESMPKAAIEFLAGLKEFDSKIFFEITGIKIEKEKTK